MFLNLSSCTRVFPWLNATRPVLCTEKGKGTANGATNCDESLGPLLCCDDLANLQHHPRTSCKVGVSSLISE